MAKDNSKIFDMTPLNKLYKTTTIRDKDITGGEFVGDFRNDAFDLGWDTFEEETKLTKRVVELNQGRAT